MAVKKVNKYIKMKSAYSKVCALKKAGKKVGAAVERAKKAERAYIKDAKERGKKVVDINRTVASVKKCTTTIRAKVAGTKKRKKK